MQCVCHIGCSSKAASGNVVIYHGGGVYTVTINIVGVSHTFEGGGRWEV